MAETAALHLHEETLDLVDVLMSLDTGKPYYGKNDMEKINALFGLYRRGILKTAGLETFIFYILHQHSDEFVIRICEDGKILRLRFRQFFAVKRGHDSLQVFQNLLFVCLNDVKIICPGEGYLEMWEHIRFNLELPGFFRDWIDYVFLGGIWIVLSFAKCFCDMFIVWIILQFPENGVQVPILFANNTVGIQGRCLWMQGCRSKCVNTGKCFECGLFNNLHDCFSRLGWE